MKMLKLTTIFFVAMLVGDTFLDTINAGTGFGDAVVGFLFF